MLKYVVILLVLSGICQASLVNTWVEVNNEDNTWRVLAVDSFGDNEGLAFVNIELSNTDGLTNLVPQVDGKAGFLLFRPSDNSTLGGVQDTFGIVPNSEVIYGVGQEFIDMTLLYPNETYVPTEGLVGEYVYHPDLGTRVGLSLGEGVFSIEPSISNAGFNTFLDCSTLQVEVAQAQVLSTVVVPEPSTLLLFVISVLTLAIMCPKF